MHKAVQYLRVDRIERPELRDEDGQVVLYHRVGVHYKLEKETSKENSVLEIRISLQSL